MPLPLLPLKFPRVGPPLVFMPPLAGASPPPRLLIPELGRAAGAGVANLFGTRDEGGFSTKEVSVVIKVSSPKSVRVL